MTAVAVDPRLRARRIEVHRDRGQRRLRRFAIVASVVGLAFGALMFSRSAWLDVNEIEVYGLDRVTLSSAETSLGFEVGAPLLTLDLGAAESALESLPWVEQATISRSWRGTITVEVVEREAVALAMVEQDEWVLVDVHGRVLSGPLATLPALPRLSGVRAAAMPGSFMSEDAAAPLAVVQALPGELRARSYGIWRDQRGELRLGIEDGPVVLMGDDTRLRAKVAAAATMLDRLMEDGAEVAELDVSVPNLPVVHTG